MARTRPLIDGPDARALAGRTCLVTGASRGIGRAIALHLGGCGADVAVNYLSSEARARQVVEAVEEAGERAVAVGADVTDGDEVEAMVGRVREELGPVDVLVNNAGITRDVAFDEMTREAFETVVEVNLVGTFNATSAVYDDLRESDNGRVVNVSSVVGRQGNYGQANYAASKSGLIGFTRTLAVELAPHGSTANCVAPGFTETDMLARVPDRAREKIKRRIPLDRFAEPEEVAGAVRFLASDRAAYVTGQVLGVDGGMSV